MYNLSDKIGTRLIRTGWNEYIYVKLFLEAMRIY